MNRKTWKRSAAAACSVAALALAGCSAAAEPSAAPGADPSTGPSAGPSAGPTATPSPTASVSPEASGRDAGDAGDRGEDGPGGRDGRPAPATESPRAQGNGGNGGNGGNAAPSTGAGRRYAQSQSGVLARLPGSDSGQCVSVGDRRDVRSGGIAAGPFDTAREGYGTSIQPGLSRRTVRLYWIPEHSESMPGLTVRMQRLQPDPGSAQTIRQQDWADADQWRFYDTNLEFPSAGTYRLRVTAGQDSGCFDLTMKG
jgi:hypothetical protein